MDIFLPDDLRSFAAMRTELLSRPMAEVTTNNTRTQ
jgi:hypothetical protein